MKSRLPHLHRPARLLPWLLLAGCATPPPAPLPRVPVTGTIGYFANPALAGPLPAAASASPDAVVYRLQVSLHALASLPTAARPIGELAWLVAQPETAQPLRTVVERDGGMVLLAGEAARRYAGAMLSAGPLDALALQSLDAVVQDGMTTSLRLCDAAAPLASTSVLVAALEHGGVRLLVAFDPGSQLELVELPAVDAADSPWLLAWPRPAPGHPHAAVAVLLRLLPGEAAAMMPALQHARELAAAEQRMSIQASAPPTVDQLLQQRRRQVLASLADPARRRPALLQFSRENGASVCTDLALVADDATLRALAEQLGGGDGLTLATPPQLQLALQRAAYRVLLHQLGQELVAPSVRAMLFAHAGAVGGDAAVLQAILDRAADPAELDRLLVQENLAFLYEDDPARRVSAFDWLRDQHHAPPDFDPLGERLARRRALRAFEQRADTGGQR